MNGFENYEKYLPKKPKKQLLLIRLYNPTIVNYKDDALKLGINIEKDLKEEIEIFNSRYNIENVQLQYLEIRNDLIVLGLVSPEDMKKSATSNRIGTMSKRLYWDRNWRKLLQEEPKENGGNRLFEIEYLLYEEEN